MTRFVRRSLGALLALAFMAPREAHAIGAVIGPADQPSAMAWARVAVAVAHGRTTRWAQIATTAGPSTFAWLVPIEPGARIDLTTDAWLDALDAATAPVVLPPPFPPSCDVTLSAEVIAPRASPTSQSPGVVRLAADLPTLSSFVASSGLAIGVDLEPELRKVFSAGEAVLALVYTAGSTLPVRSLRIVDTGPASLPFGLTGTGSGSVPVTVFTIADTEEQAGSAPLVLAAGSLVWLSSGQSNYLDDLASLLASSGGSAWFNQSAGPSVFFRPTVVSPSLAVPSVLEDYYAFSSKYGDTSADPDACTMAAVGTMESPGSYAAACPAGGLAVAQGPSPCSVSAPSDTPIAGLECGAVADAALAVATLEPASVWVTRLTGIVTETSAADVPVVSDGTTSESSVLVASSYPSGCDENAPDAGWGSSDGGIFEGGSGDDGGGDFLGDGGLGGDDGGAWGLLSGDASVLEAVGDATSSAADSCDSSSDGDDPSSGCGGDSSSSDDASSGCSGGSSSSSGGEGCSGNNDCTTAKHGHRTRSPVSRCVIVAAMILGIARRCRSTTTTQGRLQS
jgi:hypothetical protein